VVLSWVLFRSPNAAYAQAYLGAMLGLGNGAADGQTVYYLLEYWPEWIACVIAALPVKVWLQDWLEARKTATAMLLQTWGPKLASLAVLAASYMKLVPGSFNPFIYFQF